MWDMSLYPCVIFDSEQSKNLSCNFFRQFPLQFSLCVSLSSSSSLSLFRSLSFYPFSLFLSWFSAMSFLLCLNRHLNKCLLKRWKWHSLNFITKLQPENSSLFYPAIFILLLLSFQLLKRALGSFGCSCTLTVTLVGHFLYK